MLLKKKNPKYIINDIEISLDSDRENSIEKILMKTIFMKKILMRKILIKKIRKY